MSRKIIGFLLAGTICFYNIFCPGKEAAMGIIVASPSCTTYLCGALIVLWILRFRNRLPRRGKTIFIMLFATNRLCRWHKKSSFPLVNKLSSLVPGGLVCPPIWTSINHDKCKNI